LVDALDTGVARCYLLSVERKEKVLVKRKCSLCGGGGLDERCPECGQTLPPNPVARALAAAHDVLETVWYHPGLVVSGNAATVRCGGRVVAEAVGVDSLDAIRRVTELAIAVGLDPHQHADIMRNADLVVESLGIGRRVA
jgi:hypothetical protein